LNTAILGILVINTQINQRTISQELNVSQSTIQRILKTNNFQAYHIQRVQGLIENQKQKRVEFCHWRLEKLEENSIFFDKVLFTDKSIFQNTGEIESS